MYIIIYIIHKYYFMLIVYAVINRQSVVLRLLWYITGVDDMNIMFTSHIGK